MNDIVKEARVRWILTALLVGYAVFWDNGVLLKILAILCSFSSELMWYTYKREQLRNSPTRMFH